MAPKSKTTPRTISMGHGKGSLFKRCDHTDITRCSCEWSIRYRGSDGQPREEGGGKQWRKKDAEARLDEINAQKRKGRHAPRPSDVPTFKEYCEKTIPRRKDIKDSSKKSYLALLRNHIYEHIGFTKLNEFRRNPHMTDLFHTLEEKKKFPWVRLEFTRAVLHTLFDLAIVDEHLETNPVFKIVLPPRPIEKREIPTREEIDAIIEALPPFMRLIPIVMAGTGMRPNEAFGVSLEKADGDVYLVDRQWIGAKWAPLKHRDEGEYRQVPLPPFVLEEMEAHAATFGTGKDGALIRGRKTRWVDGTEPDHFRDTPITPATWQYYFDRARIVAGIRPEITAHSIRHYYASVLIANDVQLTDVADYLGHRDVKTTHSIYKHLLEVSFTKAANLVQKIWTTAA